MKDLKKLKGAKVINKNEQRIIKGGLRFCEDGGMVCPYPLVCINYTCVA